MLKLLIALILVSGCGQQEFYPQKGDRGDVGSAGPSGPAGANGTVITVVKLCPGTTTYPSTFVEDAFCINNKLYAVYSLHDGFLTEIPPGNYSSNGFNASCSFTVTANCGVH